MVSKKILITGIAIILLVSSSIILITRNTNTPKNIDCRVGDFDVFSTCTQPCGGGTMTRNRAVLVFPTGLGRACPPLTETVECNTQVCPVDCQVSEFGEFSPCTRECDGGTRTRTRTILVPPAGTGAVCPHLTETVECNTQLCPPVDCQVSDFGEFSPCTRPCGGGTKTRNKTILVPPAGAGAACPRLTETVECNTQVCPVDCRVSDFSEFSPCTRECDGGTRIRTRTILAPPVGAGAVCPHLTETVECNTQLCPPVDCKVSEFRDASACTVPCGGGTKTRTRDILVPAAGLGRACPPVAELTETVACNTQPCPVDCQVGDYGEFSPCTRPCGGGTKTKNRTILVYPIGAGAPCPRLTETVECNTQVCPVDCQYTTTISDCTPCGSRGGTKLVTNNITRQAEGAGLPCPPPTQILSCQVDCPPMVFIRTTLVSATYPGGVESLIGTSTRQGKITKLQITAPFAAGTNCFFFGLVLDRIGQQLPVGLSMIRDNLNFIFFPSQNEGIILTNTNGSLDMTFVYEQPLEVSVGDVFSIYMYGNGPGCSGRIQNPTLTVTFE